MSGTVTPKITVDHDDSHEHARGFNNDDLSVSEEELPPPAYGSIYGTIDDEQGGATATVGGDGRVNIRINQKTKGLSSLLVPALKSRLDVSKPGLDSEPYISPSLTARPGEAPPPPLNVVIHVVGSRGDVQPFVALGKVLKEKHGHRVRLATHPVFKDFVTENGLEFFNIAGDPSELMAFMVKNPGLMPGFDTLRRGDIGKRRRDIGNMIGRCWRSCIEAGDGFGPEASDNAIEEWANDDSGMSAQARPFVADAIIANPPSFAHIHCAEKLGIPLHLMFTMPWSPTQAFPHPLANITSTNADASLTNFMSYALVDMMTWQGLGDIINRFRQNSLNLEPISMTWAPGMLARMKVPFTYCWSPTLIPKPRDWAKHINISGFFFLSLASGYTPEPDLAAFLEAGPPPVYIGFGSIVVDDPNAMTKLIFDAVKKTGQRTLVSKGWGGIGADQIGIPDGVFMLGNVPHDWLFQKVSCVVHHGGAGTTAAGIACGKPTVIVPFFGDQPFWGSMVARAGAGPKPVAYKDLTADILAASITEALKPQFVEKAKAMADSIAHEKGSENGAQAFHRMLDMDKMRCTLAPHRAATWRIKRTEIRLSAFAATVLGNEQLLDFNDMKLYRPQEHDVEDEPWDPITGGASAIFGTMSSMAMGVSDMPIQTLKALKIHPDAAQGQGPAGKVSREPGDPPRRPSLSQFLSARKSRSRGGSIGSDDGSRGRSQSPENRNMATSPASQSTTLLASGQNSPSREDMTLSPSVTTKSSQSSKPKYDPESALFGTRSASLTPSTTATQKSSSSPRQGSPAAKEKAKEPFDLFSAIETGKGVYRMASAGVKSPMDFTLALARGFHNAPKLYGDDSVRKSEKITDFGSGLRAAGKELKYGMYDGITGLVTQPLAGAKKEGAAGFFKGVGRGIGGIVFKPGAAFWGIPGYTSKGIYKELQKMFGPSVDNYIIAARTAQGMEEATNSTPEEREAVIRRWKEMRPYVRKKTTLKGVPKEQKRQLLQKRQDIRNALKEKCGVTLGGSAEDDDPNFVPLGHGIERVGTMDSDVFSLGGDDSVDWQPLATMAAEHAQRTRERNMQEQSGNDESSNVRDRNLTEDETSDEELEAVVRRSVTETSRGNQEEDAMLQRAIRDSVAGLSDSGHTRLNPDELRRAIDASIHDARDAAAGSSQQSKQHDERSRGQSSVPTSSTDHEPDDEEMRNAMTASKDEHDRNEEARHEEEIIMKYIMRQSLLEEEAAKKKREA